MRGDPGLLGGRGGGVSIDLVSPELGEMERELTPSSFVRFTGGGAGSARWKCEWCLGREGRVGSSLVMEAEGVERDGEAGAGGREGRGRGVLGIGGG